MSDEIKVSKAIGGDGSSYEIIEPPNRLLAKAGNFRIDTDRVTKLEAKLTSLSDRYPDIAQDELVKLRDAWRAFKDAPADAPTLERFWNISHDFKGQGGSFGYPLVTRVATSLCLLLRHGDPANPRRMPAIALHVGAIEAILAERLSGEGGTKGSELQATLRALLEACCPNQAVPGVWA